MNTKKQKDKVIDEALKEAYREIEPPDSWQALRARIDSRIDSRGLPSASDAETIRNIIFWRRLAIAMAACFLLTAGILIYLLCVSYGIEQPDQQKFASTATHGLLDQEEMNRLMFAFTQVRQLFGQQSRWIMIGSGNRSQMGLDGEIGPALGDGNVVVVRLGVNPGIEGFQQQYFDIVTFSNQEASFRLPVPYASDVEVSLKPILKSDGTIEVEISAQAEGGSQARSISTVADNVFTPLVRMRANGSWVNIEGVGQSMSDI